MTEEIQVLLDKIEKMTAEQAKLSSLVIGVGTRVKETKEQLGGISTVAYDNAEKLHDLGEFHKTLQKRYEVWPTQSESIANLLPALQKFLNNLKTPEPTGKGPHSNTKCLSIDDMRGASLGELEKNNLFFTQDVLENEYSEPVLCSRLIHSPSKEWMGSNSRIRVILKAGINWDHQEFTKAISYLRRNHMHTMMGFGKDEE